MFLDIAFALFVAKISAGIFLVDNLPLLTVFALFSVLLPDADIVYFAYKKYVRNVQLINHRSCLHYPLLYLVPSLLLFILSPVFSFIFVTCVLFHFIHDTFFLGWGVAWFAPFRETRYKCFPDRAGKITSIPYISWEKSEDAAMFAKYHNPKWIRDFYMRPGVISLLEYSVLTLSLLYFFS